MKISMYTRCLILSIAAILILVAGCSSGSPKAADSKSEVAKPIDVEGAVRDDVVLTTSDGISIHATHVIIDDGKPHPSVVLCHQFKSDRKSYSGMQNKLAAKGINSLAIDFRGFGDSTENGLTYTKFKDSDYQAMLEDIKAAVAYVTGPDSGKVGIVGASIGANLAIMAAARFSEISCVAALSPGRDYHGLQPLPDMAKLTIPVFIAYGKNDTQSAEVIDELKRAYTGDDLKGEKIEDDSHGTAMFKYGVDVRLATWLAARLTK